jgi:hypothetical protein
VVRLSSQRTGLQTRQPRWPGCVRGPRQICPCPVYASPPAWPFLRRHDGMFRLALCPGDSWDRGNCSGSRSRCKVDLFEYSPDKREPDMMCIHSRRWHNVVADHRELGSSGRKTRGNRAILALPARPQNRLMVRTSPYDYWKRLAMFGVWKYDRVRV